MAAHVWTPESLRKLSETRKRMFAEGTLRSCANKTTAVPVIQVPDSFGYWLAGLTDGEGCFGAYAVRGRVHVLFKIALRLDDRPVLDDACLVTGLGNVRKTHTDPKYERAPCAAWTVGSAAECVAIAELFSTFPLRAKKSRELAPWKRIATAIFSSYRLAPEAVQEDLDLLASLKRYVPPSPLS